MSKEPCLEVWTVQQFTTVAGEPWYALQRHGEASVEWQFTGYRHEVEQHIGRLGITPELLEPTDDNTSKGLFLVRARKNAKRTSSVRSRSAPGQWKGEPDRI